MNVDMWIKQHCLVSEYRKKSNVIVRTDSDGQQVSSGDKQEHVVFPPQL